MRPLIYYDCLLFSSIYLCTASILLLRPWIGLPSLSTPFKPDSLVFNF